MFKFVIKRHTSMRWFACAIYYWNEYVIPDDKVCGHGTQAVGSDSIDSIAGSFGNDPFYTKLFKVVCCMSGQVIGITGMFPDRLSKFRRGNAEGVDRESDQRFHKRPDARIIDVDAGNTSGFVHRRQMPRLQRMSIDEAYINAVKHRHEPVKNVAQHFSNLCKTVDFSAALQPLCIVNDSLEAKNTFAFAINLEGKAIEVHLEHRKIIDRFLDRNFKSGRLAARGTFIGTVAVAEDGLERSDIQTRSGFVDHPVEHGIDRRPSGKQQVPAELKLIDRVAVTEIRTVLIFKFQCKTQAAGINPTLTNIEQPPYIPIVRDHGVCDSVQCRSVGYIGKTVVLFGESDATFTCRPFHILMAVENVIMALKGGWGQKRMITWPHCLSMMWKA